MDEENNEINNDSKKRSSNIQEYRDNTNVRSLSIVFLDENRLNLFYHNLIKHSYNSDEKSICLKFTTDDIEILGDNMLNLYYLIKSHKVLEIFISPKSLGDRYSQITNEKEITVTEVKIISRE
jgi:hypothetical protein